MADPLAAALHKLLDADAPLFASQFTPAQRRQIDSIRQKIGGTTCQLHGNSVRYQLTGCSKLVLFADYDGVGLSNFVRLKQRCPDAQFWLMPHWQDKILRYGNQEIWQNTHDDFVHAYANLLQQHTGQSATALQKTAEDNEVLALCQQLQQHGSALEQEAIWW